MEPPQGKRILGDKYEFGEVELGRGAFGIVWQARDTTGKEFAIKEIPKSNLTEEGDAGRLSLEIMHQFCLRHPGLVQLHEFYESPSAFYLVQELAKGGTLLDLVGTGPIPASTARRYFQQIVSAIAYMEHNTVCHRDIKLENCILTENDDVMLCDFGLSVQFKNPEDGRIVKQDSECGSSLYMAPEVFEGEYDASAADVWSLGVLLYAMLTGNFPFDSDQRPVLISLVKAAKPSYPDDMPYDAKDLLQKIFVVNPAHRLTIDGIIDHPWVRQDFEYVNAPGEAPRQFDVNIGRSLSEDPAPGDLMSASLFQLIGVAGPVRLERLIWDQFPCESSRVVAVDRPQKALREDFARVLAEHGTVDVRDRELSVHVVTGDGQKLGFALRFYPFGSKTILGIDKTDGNMENMDSLVQTLGTILSQ